MNWNPQILIRKLELPIAKQIGILASLILALTETKQFPLMEVKLETQKLLECR
jgi:hypothetical protein